MVGKCSKYILFTIKFLKISLNILRIVIPLSLIILIIVDFYKAIISSDDAAIKKATNSAIRRTIAGIVVFFIPTIVTFTLNLFKGQQNILGELFSCASYTESVSLSDILRINSNDKSGDNGDNGNTGILAINSVSVSDVVVTINASKGSNDIAGYYFSNIKQTPSLDGYDWINNNTTTFKTIKFPGTYYVYVKDTANNIAGGEMVTVNDFYDTTMLHKGKQILNYKSIEDYITKNHYYNNISDFTKEMASYNKKYTLRTRESVVIGAMFFTGKLQSWGITLPYSGGNYTIDKDSWGIYKYWGSGDKSFLACNPFVIWAFKNAGLNIYGNRNKIKSEITKETREVAAGTEYFKTVKPPYEDYNNVLIAHYLIGALGSNSSYGDNIIPRKNGQPGDVLQSFPSSGHDMLIVDKYDDNNDGMSDGYIVLQSRDIGLCYEKVPYKTTIVYDMSNIYNNSGGFANYLNGWNSYYIPTSDYPDYLR